MLDMQVEYWLAANRTGVSSSWNDYILANGQWKNGHLCGRIAYRISINVQPPCGGVRPTEDELEGVRNRSPSGKQPITMPTISRFAMSANTDRLTGGEVT